MISVKRVSFVNWARKIQPTRLFSIGDSLVPFLLSNNNSLIKDSENDMKLDNHASI